MEFYGNFSKKNITYEHNEILAQKMAVRRIIIIIIIIIILLIIIIIIIIILAQKMAVRRIFSGNCVHICNLTANVN